MTEVVGAGCNGGGATAGAETVYELDWTALDDQLAIADGPLSIDGINWTAANTANATLFQILNGTGLQITATAGTPRTWESVQNAPAMYVEIASLGDLLNYSKPISIWSYLPAFSVPELGNQVSGSTLWTPAATGYANTVSGVGVINASSTTKANLQRTTLHSQSANTALAGSTVFVWRSTSNTSADCFAGTWGGDWPAWTDLVPVGSDPNITGSASLNTDDMMRRPGSALVYFAATRSSAGAPAFTLAKTRIQLG